MTEELTLEKLDTMISQKIAEALKPITEKLDAIKPVKPEEKKDEEQTDKLDAFKLAEQTLRAKLDGFVEKEKLDKMDMLTMSQTLAKLQGKFAEQKGGILNQVEQNDKDKLDALFKKDAGLETVWEE
jgi:hypothetical protein